MPMKQQLLRLLSLHEGEEQREITLEKVKANISFKGSNLWILVCAIIIASVGLNVNSGAVIIGAMLISPLMGPIVGAGFALGMYDFPLLKRSLRNLLTATFISLASSSLYFLLSPFKSAQSELLARTAPNIYDIVIAFFGGLVGVIAITRVEKGNPIPGVAIATALMPPLCTAGFGLATGNIRFFLGALFLYTINCVFICIATVAIVKYLRYPSVSNVNEQHQRQVKYLLTSLTILLVLPAGYFAFSLYREQQFKQRAAQFIENEFERKGIVIVYQKTKYAAGGSTIELAFLKKNYSAAEKDTLQQLLSGYELSNTRLIIDDNSLNNLDKFRDDLLNEVRKRDEALDDKDKRMAQLEQRLVSNSFDDKKLSSEVMALFPDIVSSSIAYHNFTGKDTTQRIPVFIYESRKKLSASDKGKLQEWLKARLNQRSVDVLSR